MKIFSRSCHNWLVLHWITKKKKPTTFIFLFSVSFQVREKSKTWSPRIWKADSTRSRVRRKVLAAASTFWSWNQHKPLSLPRPDLQSLSFPDFTRAGPPFILFPLFYFFFCSAMLNTAGEQLRWVLLVEGWLLQQMSTAASLHAPQ